MQKQVQYVIKGMQRDPSISKAMSEFSFENMNIRITARENNTLLSITNEKGNKEIILDTTIEGTLLGHCVLNNFIILFSKGNKDNIYRVESTTDGYDIKLLYSGNLGFSTLNPIETIGIYENEDIQKVYWTDNKNQPRVLNFSDKSLSETTFTDGFFDFVPDLKLEETVIVKRGTTSLGNFPSGTIQYAFTYFNKYGQESNIFYQSPLLYTSPYNRGGSPEEKNNSNFYIEIQDPDVTFSHIRVYSILRTSIDSTPTVKAVVDLSTKDISTRVEEGETINYLSYTDNGDLGTIVDPTELLYVGGESILAGTISYKDQTLFLGDITLKRSTIPSEVVSALKSASGESGVYFPLNESDNTRGYWKSIDYNNISGKYPYTNSLNLSSEDIKIFKTREVYRFGVQLQDSTGKWSEVVYLKDLRNDLNIDTGNSFTDENNDITVRIPMPAYTLTASALDAVRAAGYRKIRGVVVYPSLTSREVVMQGILCPTVYNVNDRYNNAPFVASSWFARPYLPFNEDEATWTNFHTAKDSYYSSKGMWESNPDSITFSDDVAEQGSTQWNKDRLVLTGSSLEFRHNHAIPGVIQNDGSTTLFPRNAEIQCLVNPPKLPLLGYDSSITNVNSQDYVSNNGEYYYIDQSIQTFHSPDFEFDDSIQNLDLSNLKLRIVGMTLMSSTTTDVEILTSTVGNNIDWATFYKESIGTQNLSYLGLKGLVSGLLWLDTIYDLSGTAKISLPWLKDNTIGFAVYPWHRNGSLNNMGIQSNGTTRQALLKQKKMSNLIFSWNNIYFKDSWTGNTIHSIPWLSTENTIEYISDSKSYSANIDKILNVTTTNVDTKRERSNGYPIIVGETLENAMSSPTITEFTSNHEKFCAPYLDLLNKTIIDTTTSLIRETIVTEDHFSNMYGVDPIRIKYKSTPHVVISFDSPYEDTQVIAPTIYSNKTTNKILNYSGGLFGTNKVFWDDKINNIEQPVIDLSQDTRLYTNGVLQLNYGYFWLAELYNDSFTDISSRFGGNTEEALQSNTWYVGSAPESLYDKEGNPKYGIKVKYTEGDTYYQRYDNLKTYPFTLEDQNSVTDIVSFMCETRVNIDGRYDRNRGKDSNLVMTPTNFNLLNNVYSQRNNFFNVSYLNRSRFNLDKFSNVITWTKSKVFGELIDTWTNVTLASTLDMDGDRGKVSSLKRFNNDIYCFQDAGISKILFNSRVQISASDGIPIELGNSAKVDGKVYLTQDIGCANKWSIVESSKGLYFIDSLTSTLYLFNGHLDALSDRLGFKQWVGENSNDTVWNPDSFSNFISFYDKTNGDVYFVKDNVCLCYSELLDQFTSFMSYEKVPAMFNVGSKFLSFKDGKLWEQGEGEYNKFFGEFKPYYIIYRVNPEEPIDKTFNSIEFRSDTWNGDTLTDKTFDVLDVWNEYQRGTLELNNIQCKPSSLKKKFRIWRALIPRDNSNHRDRIRNPWAYIKLSMNKENYYRTELHDLIVHYFE